MSWLIFDTPTSRSTNVIGTSTTVKPARRARQRQVDLEAVALRLRRRPGPIVRSALAPVGAVAGGDVVDVARRAQPGVEVGAAREHLAVARPVAHLAAGHLAGADDEVRAAVSAASSDGSCSGGWRAVGVHLDDRRRSPRRAPTRSRRGTPRRARPSRRGAARGPAGRRRPARRPARRCRPGEPSSTTRTSASGTARAPGATMPGRLSRSL